MRSFSALALGLALAQSSFARVANGATTDAGQVSTSGSGSVVVNWLGRLFRREAQITCFEDEYYEFVSQETFGEQFCQDFMGYPAITATVETTPVTTTTEVYSTVIITQNEVQHTTVVATSTVLITPTPIAKREAALNMNEIFQGFRREKAALNDTIDTPQMSASFSSACNCQTYAGPTETATITNSAKVATIRAFERETTTIVSVQTDATITTTATIATAAPTAPAFSCPDDNNSTVSQLIGNERFDYLVLCSTDISDMDFYNVLSYSSFSECAAACSIADARFDSPVCQGFSYYATTSANNCFLKGTANQTVPATGVDSAVLQRIAVGLTDDMPAGTNTESAPFAGETQTLDPSQLSSSMSQFIANSSTSIPVITPGPNPISGRPVSPGETSYSTYISDGSTYSSGTVFSTYYTSNGSWYYTYYTAYTQSWASETTVYASSETGTSVSNTTDTETSTQAGNNGEYYTITTTNTTSYYPGGYNVTEVTSNVTSASNGSQIASTAVTSYYSIATGGSGGGSGGSGSGGITSNGAGNITGAGVTSTSVFSTFTVFSNGGQTGGSNGGAGSGALQTPAPSVFATSGQTAFNSGFAASGAISGGSAAPTSVVSTIVTIDGTAFSSGFAASGGSGGEGSVDSTAASGGILSPSTGIPFTPISSTNGVGQSAFSTGFGASGLISGASDASSTGSSSGLVTSSAAVPIPISSTRSSAGTEGAGSTAASGSSPFTNSNRDRSGTQSTSSPTSVPTPSTPASSPTVSSSRSVAVSSPSGSLVVSSLPGSLTTSSPSGSLAASSSSGPLLSASLNTTALVSTSVAGTPSTQSAPRPTGPVPYAYVPFTNSNGLRTYIPSGSSVPSGFATASDDLSFDSFSTGTGLILTSQTSALVSTPTRPGVTQLIPYPTGSAPSSGFPFSSGVASTGFMPSGSAPSGTRPFFSTGTASSGFPFSNSELPRTGSQGLSTRTSPASASPPYPTGASSCVPSYLGTTTILTTVTEYGCYSNCPAQASALTFGPPSVNTAGPGGYY